MNRILCLVLVVGCSSDTSSSMIDASTQPRPDGAVTGTDGGSSSGLGCTVTAIGDSTNNLAATAFDVRGSSQPLGTFNGTLSAVFCQAVGVDYGVIFQVIVTGDIATLVPVTVTESSTAPVTNGSVVMMGTSNGRAWACSISLRGAPSVGSFSMTTASADVAGPHQYTVHGQGHAVCPAIPGTTATGNVTIDFTF
jgi:hypothetical protein